MPGIQEWILILFVALVVLGPDRLPEVARTAGRLLSRFRAETRRNVDELKRMAEIQELEREVQGLRSELRETREDLDSGGARRPVRRGGTSARQPGGPRGAWVPRAEDDPPPVDPEAT